MKLLILPAVLLVSLLCPAKSQLGGAGSPFGGTKHLENLQNILATETTPEARIAALNNYANDNNLTSRVDVDGLLGDGGLARLLSGKQ